MNAALVVIVPIRWRAHRVKPLLDSLRESTPEPWRALFICDPDDDEVIAAIEAEGADLLICKGKYGRKVNVGVAASPEPLIFIGADDLKFHPGWLEAAKEKLTKGIGVVGTNDLGNPRVIKGDHATHFLLTREYAERGLIDEPGKVMFEGYQHEFVDDELVETARYRKAYAHAHDSHVEHLHPAWGKAPTDAFYAKSQQRMKHGRRLFLKRRRLWTTT